MLYGTKIIVIDSNVQRKSGPRRGSLGFVISSSPFFLSPDNKHVVRSMTVLFFRYGFEKKYRYEIKKVHVVVGPAKVIEGQLTKNILSSMINTAKKWSREQDTVVLTPLSEKTGCMTNEEIKAFLVCCLNVPENWQVLSSIQGEDTTPGRNIIKAKNLAGIHARHLIVLLFQQNHLRQLEIVDQVLAVSRQRIKDTVSFFTKLRSIQILAGLVQNNNKNPIAVELSLKGKLVYNSGK